MIKIAEEVLVFVAPEPHGAEHFVRDLRALGHILRRVTIQD